MATNTVPIPAAPAPVTQNTLYVVLHGLISLVDVGGSGFIAYALEIGDAHRYLFGNWLTEKEIPARISTDQPLIEKIAKLIGKEIPALKSQPLIAELTGVDSGTATLDTNQNVIVLLQKAPDLDHDDVRAVFKLPRPAKIHHFVSGDLDPNNGLNGTTGAIQGKPVALTSIRIFEYTFKDSAKVQLTRAIGTKALWQCPGPVDIPGKNISVAVLHIYDQPGQDMDGLPKHTQEEFAKSAAFLGTDLTLADPVVVTNRTALKPGILPGLLAVETSCLSKRAEEVLELMDAVRVGDLGLSTGTGGCGGGGVCAPCNAVLAK